MKIKAIIFAATIFGATFYVTSTSDNNGQQNEIKKQAVEKSTIKVPRNG